MLYSSLSAIAALFVSIISADVIPPEALNNVAHVAFPRDHVDGQILKIQRDNFGLPPGLRCSSLLGPKCTSREAAQNRIEMEYSDDTPSDPIITIKKLEINNPDNAEATGEGSITLDTIIIAQLGLGPPLSREEVEDAKNVFEELDPGLMADVADRVAEVAQIEDKDRFRHKFLSAFANLLVEEDIIEDEETEEEGYGYTDDFFMHPSKADQEHNWEAKREKAKLDRITKRIKSTMADMLSVHRYKDEEDDVDDGYVD